MFIKNVKLLSLGLALSTAIGSCFAAQEGDWPEKSVAKLNQAQTASPVKLLEEAASLYTFTCNKMQKNSLAQASSFGKVVSILDLAISHLQGDISLDTPKELKAISLKQQAVTLHNYVCNNYISTRESSSSFKSRVGSNSLLSSTGHPLLKEAVTAIRKSCDLYKELNDIQNYNTSLAHLGVILLAFSENCAIKADAEEDPETSLSLFIESVDCMQESRSITPTATINTDLSAALAISLHKTVNIFADTNDKFLQLCQPTDATIQHYKLLIDNANLTRKILDYLNKYIMDSSLDFIVVTEPGTKEKFRSKGNARSRSRGGKTTTSTFYPSPTGKNVNPVLNPREFIMLPWTTYCGALQRASLTMSALSIQCLPQLTEAYNQKAQLHAADAFDFYKTNVYQGEYAKDLGVEKAFIEARLADIVGNPVPLAEFYKALRQKRKDEQHQKLLEMIKAKQEAQRQQEEERRQQEAAKKAQQEVSRILPEGESVDSSALVPSIEIVSTPINQPSVFIGSSSEIEHRKEKVKTRGIGKPQPTSLLKDTPTLEEERKKVALSSDDHDVFHSLTGGNLDRNISLDQVKTLLTSPALGCKITTGGSHPGKATASNGKMWTIPSPWKGPIPHYYRHQLNDFLQNSMDIDPGDVVRK